ncbi:hypothetical protein BDV96DRAFT_283717 [Lophiotrema nucula]|uniref:Uncharacterized protein n=1 Tax=Lophiotrema nucula TaxID=690887 RepID=A0A6A5YPI6_9PLEO|nr:hypothetical protein BDV96DRAFT_283717 [Lophiotrema nucula]
MAQQLSPTSYSQPRTMALQYSPGHPNFGQSAQPSQAESAAYAVEYPPVPDRTFIWKALMGLDDIWICTLLLRISDTQARVAWEIWDECKRRRRDPQLAREMAQRKKARRASQQRSLGVSASENQTRRGSIHSDASTASVAQTTLTFDEEARAIWFMLKREHTSRGDGAQLEASSLVYKDIIWIMNHIREQTAAAATSFESRRNALETLRNIGESILNAPGVLGYEVRKRFRDGAGLKDAMVSILRPMKFDDRDKLANINDCQSTFHERVAALASKGADHEIFGEMRSVADFLRGELTMRELDKLRSTSCPDEVDIKGEDQHDAGLLSSAPQDILKGDVTRGIKRRRHDTGNGSESSGAMTIDVQSANRGVVSMYSARQDSALGHSDQHTAVFSSSQDRTLSRSSNSHSQQAPAPGRSSLHLPEIVDSDSSDSFDPPLRREPRGVDLSDHPVHRYAVPERFDLT